MSVSEEEMTTFLVSWLEEYDYAADAWARRAADPDGSFRADVATRVSAENVRKREIVQAIIDKLG